MACNRDHGHAFRCGGGAHWYRLASWIVLCCMVAGCKRTDDIAGGPATGTLSGIVVADAETPLADATVEVVGYPAIVSQRTDGTGAFSLGVVPVGIYDLRVTAPPGYEAPPSAATPSHDRRVWTVSQVPVRPSLVTNVTISALGVRERTRILQAGTVDTVVLADGGIATVAVPPGASVSATVASAPYPVVVIARDLFPVAKTIRIRLAPVANRAAMSQHGRRYSTQSADNGLNISLSIGSLRVNSSQPVRAVLTTLADPDVLLWATATSTVVQTHGQTWTVPLTAFSLSVAEPVDISVTLIESAGGTPCPLPLHSLRPLDETPLNGRIPLILVHGWQPEMVSCNQWLKFMSQSDPFDAMIAEVVSDVPVAAQYKPYIFRYATYERVMIASDALAIEVEKNGLVRPVLVGHSMGGLVGRGVMALRGPDALRGLITLGTPHEGTPLANRIIDGGKTDCVLARLQLLGGELAAVLAPSSGGLADLRTDSELIALLRNEATRPRNRVFAIAGTNDATLDLMYGRFACVLRELGAGKGDGVVPTSSAAPPWATLRIERDGHDHTEMAKGTRDGKLFDDVRAALIGIAACGTPPSRPTSNAFPLSASIDRLGNDTVNIIVNPIHVNGSPIVGLTSANFEVIENDCSRPFVTTTGTAPVPVDVVFVQDLSSSMRSAIAGVRNSVIAFARDLAERNLEVRMASVGFSGPGNIPSTPPTSRDEFLGPVQDFTTPAVFQQHVASQWREVGGADPPENGLEAIEYAQHSLSWRREAARVYILITDASLHTKNTSCNGRGPCTDHDLVSIMALVGSSATVHAVASSRSEERTTSGGLDPWLLADAFGGRKLTLGTGGTVDLPSLGIASVIGQLTRLTFKSLSKEKAWHDLRVRVTLPDGRIAEIAPGVIQYSPLPGQ